MAELPQNADSLGRVNYPVGGSDSPDHALDQLLRSLCLKRTAEVESSSFAKLAASCTIHAAYQSQCLCNLQCNGVRLVVMSKLSVCAQ